MKPKTVAGKLAEVSEARRIIEKMNPKIFSGDYSRDMWDKINNAKTIYDLRWALYIVCCKIQELESKIDRTGKESLSISELREKLIKSANGLDKQGFTVQAVGMRLALGVLDETMKVDKP